MSNNEELKDVVKENLEETGLLNEIRSRMRSGIFNLLNDKQEEKQKPSRENLIINELIKEYLDFNNYNYTNTTMISETNHPKEGVSRDFITHQIGVVEDTETKQIPLLYSLVFGNKKFVKEGDKGNKNQNEKIYENIFKVSNPNNIEIKN